jgi:hypothetical protein
MAEVTLPKRLARRLPSAPRGPVTSTLRHRASKTQHSPLETRLPRPVEVLKRGQRFKHSREENWTGPGAPRAGRQVRQHKVRRPHVHALPRAAAPSRRLQQLQRVALLLRQPAQHLAPQGGVVNSTAIRLPRIAFFDDLQSADKMRERARNTEA